MPKGFRTAFSLTATLFALAAGTQADDTRQSILHELNARHPNLRDVSRDQLIQGEFTNVSDRKFYGFRLMTGSAGETFVERTIASGSESDTAGKSIALITPTQAVHVVQENPGQTPRVWKYRPDGMGSYARLLAAMRDDLADAAEAAWSVHGTDVAALLGDPRVSVIGVERISSQDAAFVRVRFDASAAPYPFDRGELQFRPDLSWTISQVILNFPASKSTGAAHRETWKIRTETWPDGSVFPAEVEKTVEYLNRHDVVKTHVAFLDRSPSFDRTRLFDANAWLAELTTSPPPPVESGIDEDNQAVSLTKMPTPVTIEPASKHAVRIMKFASPASGALTVLILASLFERYRIRSRPNRRRFH
jgi:hypothetical protein